MKAIYIILILHIILIIFASTNFTILTFAQEGTSFSCNYWTYSYRNGFGSTYISEYSLLQVLTFIAAYATGFVLFAVVYRKGLSIIGLTGLGTCAIGLVSFLIEVSHWIFEHHLSWIASFPIVMVVLWILIIVSLLNRNKIQIRNVPAV